MITNRGWNVRGACTKSKLTHRRLHVHTRAPTFATAASVWKTSTVRSRDASVRATTSTTRASRPIRGVPNCAVAYMSAAVRTGEEGR